MIKRLAASCLQSSRVKAALDGIERHSALVRNWHNFAYERHFARITPWARDFRGVYGSFAEAMRSAPSGKSIGYDNEAGAKFLPACAALIPSDYPVLFWLRPVMKEGAAIFDLGGYVGISYYSYRGYLPYPSGLRWTIYDVPAVLETGRTLAAGRDSVGLHFTDNLQDANGADVMLALGSLQFIEQPLSELLSALQRPPQHLILNKLPLADGPQFVTLQNMGPSVAPYYIFNRKAYTDSLVSCGYEVVDTWDNAEFACHIPFHPEKYVPRFSGMYLRLRPDHHGESAGKA